MWHPCNLAAKESGLECTYVKHDDFTVLVSGGSRCHWVSTCTVWLSHSKWLRVQQQICIKFCVKLEHSSVETIWIIQKTRAVGNCWLEASSWQCTCSCITFCAVFFDKHQIIQVTQPLNSQDLAPWDFWLFPKWKSPLKGKRFYK